MALILIIKHLLKKLRLKSCLCYHNLLNLKKIFLIQIEEFTFFLHKINKAKQLEIVS